VNPLESQFGQIDIYLFDQLLKGRIAPGMSILDAGCGQGRNLVHFLRQNHPVQAADSNPFAIESVRRLAQSLAPQLPPTNFRHEPVESMSFPDASAEVVLSSAVLHFAANDQHFEAMLQGSWRVLAPGGLFFCRLASTIGIESQIQPLENRRYRLPDGSDRYLVDEPLLAHYTQKLAAIPLDPLKTTIVQNQRAMTTWVLRKSR
jgi:ubiquinone/menaquinone biosynthesis C-methylase UbiE